MSLAAVLNASRDHVKECRKFFQDEIKHPELAIKDQIPKPQEPVENMTNYKATAAQRAVWDPTMLSPTNTIDHAVSFTWANRAPETSVPKYGKQGFWRDYTSAIRNVQDVGYHPQYLNEPIPDGVNATVKTVHPTPGYLQEIPRP